NQFVRAGLPEAIVWIEHLNMQVLSTRSQARFDQISGEHLTPRFFGATALGATFINRITNDDLKQRRMAITSFTKDSSKTLNVFSRTACATQNDGNFGFGDIYPFIEDFGGHNSAIHACLKAFQNLLAFSRFGFMGEGGNQVLS